MVFGQKAKCFLSSALNESSIFTVDHQSHFVRRLQELRNEVNYLQGLSLFRLTFWVKLNLGIRSKIRCSGSVPSSIRVRSLLYVDLKTRPLPPPECFTWAICQRLLPLRRPHREFGTGSRLEQYFSLNCPSMSLIVGHIDGAQGFLVSAPEFDPQIASDVAFPTVVPAHRGRRMQLDVEPRGELVYDDQFPRINLVRTFS